MKQFILYSIVGFVLATALTVLAAEPTAALSAAKPPPSPAPAAVHNQTAVACNVCFTCGGDWPVFAGAYGSVITPGANPLERGSSCSGSIVFAPDSNPFLCCR
jgi:hypothetical protein